jgi:hypothetical protein
MRVLELLASNAGQVVTRLELQRTIWGEHTHVDFDASLATCINQVRTALGDRAAAPRFVETLPRRGYRFVAPVEAVDRTAGASPVATVPIVDVSKPKHSGHLMIAGVATVGLAAVAIFIAGAIKSPTPSPALTAAATGPVPAPSVPVVVLPVMLSPELAHLEPLASTLTDALIGALTTEGGSTLRVASPTAVRHLRGTLLDLESIKALGPEYFVTTKLWLSGQVINVHAKVTDISGWMLWSTDRVFKRTTLERDQVALSTELSKLFLDQIQTDKTKRLALHTEARR